MILKVQYPEGAWKFIDSIREVTSQPDARSRVFGGTGDYDDAYVKPEETPVDGNPPNSLVCRLVCLVDSSRGAEHRTIAVEYGRAFLLNDNGKTIDRF